MGNLKADILAAASPCGQEHIVAFWDKLSDAERETLADQVKRLDIPRFIEITKRTAPIDTRAVRLETEPFVRLPADDAGARDWQARRVLGQKALRAGKVAAMVVAGGQGTRLGFDGPKGAFPIGPVTGRTLFQIHAEKVLAASRRYGRTIPFLVMTGPSNDSQTRFFFNEHGFFNLPLGSVRIFEQGELPAVDDRGKVVLDRPGHIFTSPNGHGGSLKALWDTGAVEWLEKQGIEYISYFQVDNPLVRAIDPGFIGLHVESGAEMSLKLLERRDPDEKLGIWLRVGGRPRIIEYSDMPPDAMHERDAKGTLKYPGGSIAIHCFSLSFVRRLNEEGFNLPYHRARKKVPCVDAAGHTVHPDRENATKFEMFVFDALDFAKKAAAVETTRVEEFSPVKNAAGADSPDTARRDMSRLYVGWLGSIGVKVPVGEHGYPVHPVEISPLAADDAAALQMNYHGPHEVTGPFVVNE